MDNWFTNLFQGNNSPVSSIGTNGIGNQLANNGAMLGTSGLNLGSLFKNIDLNGMSQFGPIASNSSSGSGSFDLGNLFKNFGVNDLTTLGGLGLGALNYKQTSDQLDKENKIRDEQMRNTREDRAYNKSVRDSNRKLRF